MIYVLVAVCLQVPACSIPLFLQYFCAVRVGLFFALVWLCDVSARPRAGSDLIIDTFILRVAEMIESFFNFENHNGSRQQTQRHVELLWWWASHLRYVVGSTWKGHLRALHRIDPSWHSRNHWAGGKHSCRRIPGTIWLPPKPYLGQQSLECPIYVSWQEKGKSLSLLFSVFLFFGRI